MMWWYHLTPPSGMELDGGQPSRLAQRFTACR